MKNHVHYWTIPLILLSTSLASAELSGVVVSAQNEQVVINRGTKEQVRPGQIWQVLRSGESVGEIRIDKVSEYSATATSQSRSLILVPGDLVSNPNLSSNKQAGNQLKASYGPDKKVATTKQEVATVRESRPDRRNDGYQTRRHRDRYERKAPRNTQREVDRYLSQPASNKSSKQWSKVYQQTYKKRTKDISFRSPTQGNWARNLNTAAQLWSAYNTYDLYNNYNGFIGVTNNPAYLIYNVAGAVNNYSLQNRQQKMTQGRMSLKMTLWDNEMVRAYSGYIANQNKADTSQAMLLESQMAAQREIDKYTAFEIMVQNTGNVAINLNPIHLHIFAVDVAGRPVQALKADPQLNTQLAPGQQAVGFVWFPKYVSSEKNIKVIFENMAGDRGELNFQTDL